MSSSTPEESLRDLLLADVPATVWSRSLAGALSGSGVDPGEGLLPDSDSDSDSDSVRSSGAEDGPLDPEVVPVDDAADGDAPSAGATPAEASSAADDWSDTDDVAGTT